MYGDFSIFPPTLMMIYITTLAHPRLGPLPGVWLNRVAHYESDCIYIAIDTYFNTTNGPGKQGIDQSSRIKGTLTIFINLSRMTKKSRCPLWNFLGNLLTKKHPKRRHAR